jgi:hypothetical protein
MLPPPILHHSATSTAGSVKTRRGLNGRFFFGASGGATALPETAAVADSLAIRARYACGSAAAFANHTLRVP